MTRFIHGRLQPAYNTSTLQPPMLVEIPLQASVSETLLLNASLPSSPSPRFPLFLLLFMILLNQRLSIITGVRQPIHRMDMAFCGRGVG